MGFFNRDFFSLVKGSCPGLDTILGNSTSVSVMGAVRGSY